MSDENEMTRVDRVRIAAALPKRNSRQTGPSTQPHTDGEDTLPDEGPDELPPGLANSNRFHDRGRIGIGGMGEVRQAYDELLQRDVAIKTLKRKLAPASIQTQRFLQEVLVTGQLDHPNII